MSPLRLVILATTDLHGHVRDRDDGTDAPYEDEHDNAIGLARVATLVREARTTDPGALLVDAGDVLEGSALSHHYARRLGTAAEQPHPMATVMNLLGYDAVALGNHELDYGLDALAAFARQLDAPLLAGNVTGADGRPLLGSTRWCDVLVDVAHPPVRVALVGVTTSAVRAWNRDLAGVVQVGDSVAAATRLVDQARTAGADVVVVLAHSGVEDPPTEENAALAIARDAAPDVVVAGHAHVEVEERRVGTRTGREVLVTAPLCWGMRLARVSLGLERRDGRWQVTGSSARLLRTRDVAEDPATVAAVAEQDAHVRGLGARVVGHASQELPTEPSRYRPTAALALVAAAQGAAARTVLGAGGPPLISLVSPVNRTAQLRAGPLTWRDVVALCSFDPEVVVVEMDGARLRAHLEHAARCYGGVVVGEEPADLSAVTNAPTPERPHGTADFDVDVAYGVGAPLTYTIDLTRPPGARVRGLAYGGVLLEDAQVVRVVVSRYRWSGAGGYPDIVDAPLVAALPGRLRTLVAAHLADASPVSAAVVPTWHLTLTRDLHPAEERPQPH